MVMGRNEVSAAVFAKGGCCGLKAGLGHATSPACHAPLQHPQTLIGVIYDLSMSESSRIYILGLGSIGCFIAHSLQSLPNPPLVTLLVHRESLLQEYASNDYKISLQVGEDGIPQKQGPFDCELIGDSSSGNPIDHLIVCVKAPATASALDPIKHRIRKHSTVCFFQNGMGQIARLNQRVFQTPSERPRYLFGIVRHGVYLKSATEAVLSGLSGCAEIGKVPSPDLAPTSGNSEFLLNNLLQAPTLRCTKLEWTDLLQVQLLKLAANCVLNPLTAILNVRNGAIKKNPEVEPLYRNLLKEISTVFANLPELQALSHDPTRFSADALETSMLDTVDKTAGNSSSMREDILKGRGTEIEYMNGWIVDRGEELGIQCPTNAFLTQLILAKSSAKASDVI
ncbi:unnamed protein product [Penicillium salamii]|uniref:2-dehydropantoate 2-reductase n=1 Tax=Penicillium salamii TaxID=1612424 RepID=A0A9W4N1W5_9EURO|nr:unnamed protein product [Penicillium salamii]CAG8224519.1 unnamed protein product [Penicillium salamii]CAG8274562.1 unnamed protein product [Penicillium salamii]